MGWTKARERATKKEKGYIDKRKLIYDLAHLVAHLVNQGLTLGPLKTYVITLVAYTS